MVRYAQIGSCCVIILGVGGIDALYKLASAGDPCSRYLGAIVLPMGGPPCDLSTLYEPARWIESPNVVIIGASLGVYNESGRLIEASGGGGG